MSSQGLYFYGSTHNKCYRNRRELTIYKFNTETEVIESKLYLESHNVGRGSDDIRSCGITSNNLLYLVGGNYLICPNNYYTESSIVRINLNTFSFKDRTLLKNIANIPTFAEEGDTNNAYKYINFPSASSLDSNDHLYLSFSYQYTGLWKLNIRGNTISLVLSLIHI